VRHSAQRIALLRPGARIVNVGRGQLVDEDALLTALQAGHLDAAALDVFVQEPLPREHPFWAMDNVIVSPHVSGDGIGWERPVVDLFLRNLQNWRTGAELENIVDKAVFQIGDPVR
jgi:phosphoglycerate dehydrogenase-like enzyme